LAVVRKQRKLSSAETMLQHQRGITIASGLRLRGLRLVH